MSRLRKAYRAAWGHSGSLGDPMWLQWLWRIIIFGAPVFFILTSVYYGITTGLWILPVLTILFVLSTHPLLTTLIYHDFYELVMKHHREDSE